MQEKRNVVISAWIPRSLSEVIRSKAFLERRTKSDVLRALLLQEFGREPVTSDLNALSPNGPREE